jgi:hypothetical protein
VPQSYTEPGAFSTKIQFVQTGCSVGIASIELSAQSQLVRRVVFSPPLPAGSLAANAATHWTGSGSFRGTAQFSSGSGALSVTQVGSYKATATLVLTEPQGGPSEQWATGTTASSYTNDSAFVPMQATGPPDGKAWASSSKDGTSEWLELTYDQPVTPKAINIWEGRGAGFITKVEAFDSGKNAWVTLWQGADPTRGAPKVFSPPLTKTSLQVNRIRLSVDTKVPDWNEIDAVALIGPTQPKGEIIWVQGGWTEVGKQTVCLGTKCVTSQMKNPPNRQWMFAFNTATGKVGSTPDQVT